MTEIYYTIVSDGTSDRSLIPVLDWLIKHAGFAGTVEGTIVDYRLFKSKNTGNHLADRILYALEYFPCDLLLIHRDAEGRSRAERLQEITNALQVVFPITQEIPSVCVVPVRMTEAWLLFSEDAIRYAAGNLSGRIPLALPAPDTLEQLPDPNVVLHNLIKLASGLGARRKQSFMPYRFQHRVTEYMNDFSQLRTLPSFSALESDLINVIRNENWVSCS